MLTDSFTGCDGTAQTADVYECCSFENPCGVAEGDCDSDSDCLGYFTCGTNNCSPFFPNDADCCQYPIPSKQKT